MIRSYFLPYPQSFSHFFSYPMHVVSRTSLQSAAKTNLVPTANSNVVPALVTVVLPFRSLIIPKDLVLEKCSSSSEV